MQTKRLSIKTLLSSIRALFVLHCVLSLYYQSSEAITQGCIKNAKKMTSQVEAVKSLIKEGEIFEAVKQMGDKIPKQLQLKAFELKSQIDQKSPTNKFTTSEYSAWCWDVDDLQKQVIAILLY